MRAHASAMRLRCDGRAVHRAYGPAGGAGGGERGYVVYGVEALREVGRGREVPRHLPPAPAATRRHRLITDRLITGRLITGRPITDRLITDRLITGRLITDRLITGRPITGRPITGRLITDRLITDRLITDRLITGRPITDRLITGRLITDLLITDRLITGRPTPHMLSQHRRGHGDTPQPLRAAMRGRTQGRHVSGQPPPTGRAGPARECRDAERAAGGTAQTRLSRPGRPVNGGRRRAVSDAAGRRRDGPARLPFNSPRRRAQPRQGRPACPRLAAPDNGPGPAPVRLLAPSYSAQERLALERSSSPWRGAAHLGEERLTLERSSSP